MKKTVLTLMVLILVAALGFVLAACGIVGTNTGKTDASTEQSDTQNSVNTPSGGDGGQSEGKDKDTPNGQTPDEGNTNPDNGGDSTDSGNTPSDEGGNGSQQGNAGISLPISNADTNTLILATVRAVKGNAQRAIITYDGQQYNVSIRVVQELSPADFEHTLYSVGGYSGGTYVGGDCSVETTADMVFSVGDTFYVAINYNGRIYICEVILYLDVDETHTHTWGAWTTITPATCTAEGTKQHTCTVCGEVEMHKIETIAHQYTDGICVTCGKSEFSEGLSFTYVEDTDS